MQIERLCQGYGLIEGPVWDDGHGLFFSDVIHGGVFCLGPDNAVCSVFEHRRGIGGMSLHTAGGLLVSGRNVAFKPFGDGASVTVFDRDEDAGRVGFNDMTTDAAGRVYVGSLGSSPVFDDGLPPRAGELFMIDLDGSITTVAGDVELTNGLAFSPDGGTLYHADSRRGTVFCYAVEGDGRLGPKVPFATPARGIPDGLVVSADGSVWVALADGGGGVAVFDAGGSEQEFIAIEEPMCTSVCFGGEDRRSLYIVSGSDGSDSDRAGSVYRCRSEVPGLAVAPARVALPQA